MRLHRFSRNNRRLTKTYSAFQCKSEWPFLSRGLFSFVRHEAQGNYKHQMIHFAGSFKQLDEEWEEWLAKFEALLQRIYWDQVHLYLRGERYGAHDYLWTSHGGLYSPSAGSDWTHMGGPRHFSSDYWPLTGGRFLKPSPHSGDRRSPNPFVRFFSSKISLGEA